MRGARVVVAQAEQVKYAHLDTSHHFVPFMVEATGVLGEAAEDFMRELVRRIYKPLESLVAGNSYYSDFQLQSKGECKGSPRKHWKETGLLHGSDLHDLAPACMVQLAIMSAV